MKKISLILSAIYFLSSSSLFAQKNEYGWKTGIQVGVMNYYGDLSNGLIANKGQLFDGGNDYGASSLGAGLMLEKQLSPSWGLRLDAGYGIITANDRSTDWNENLELDNPNFARSLNFRTEVLNGSISLVYHLNNGYLLPKNSAVAPYISIGIGVTDFEVRGDLYVQDSLRYHYWSDNSIRNLAENDPSADEAIILEQDQQYETKLNGLQTEGVDYETLIWDIPVGLGIDFRLSDRVNLGVYAQLRFTSTDYLDDVSGNYLKETSSLLQEYASNPSNVNIERTPNRGNTDSDNDWYSFTGVQLSYRFGMRIKKFKAPRFFAYIESPAPPIDIVEPKTPESVELAESAIKTEYIEPAPVVNKMPTPKKAVVVQPPAVIDTMKPIVLDTVITLPGPIQPDTFVVIREPVKVDTMPSDERTVIVPVVLDTASVEKDSLIVITDSMKIILVDTLETESKESAKPKMDLALTTDKKDTVVIIKEEKQFLPTPVTVVYPESSTRSDSQLYEMNASIWALQASLEADEVEKTEKLMNLEAELELIKAQMLAMKEGNSQRVTIPDSEVQRQLNQIQAQLNQLTSQPDELEVSTESLALTEELNQLKMDQAAKEEKQVALEAEISRLSNEKDSTTQAQKDAQMLSLRQELDQLKIEQEKARIAAELAEKAALTLKLAEMEATNKAETQRLETKQAEEMTAVHAELARLTAEKLALADAVDSLSQVPKVELIAPKPAGINMAGLTKSYVYFKSGSKTIMERDFSMLNSVAEQLVQFPKMKIRLTGYTDKSGSLAVNQRLSKERVDAVRTYLISKSVIENQVEVQALGASTSTALNEALDRRVELVLELPKE